MRSTLFLALASAALLSAACTRAPAPSDTAAPSRSDTAPTEQAPMPPEPASRPPAATPAAPTVHLALSGEGLTFVTPSGSTRHLLFGEPADHAVEAVSRAQGSQPEHAHNDECGAGPLDMATWPNGLTLVAQEGRFVGWGLFPGAGTGIDDDLGTMAGIAPGSTRGELESAYAAKVSETTLGTEFIAGGLSGLLDGPGPRASITTLWAGTNCAFR